MFTTWWGLLATYKSNHDPTKKTENSAEGLSKGYRTSKEENAMSRSERLPLEMAFEKDAQWWHADSQGLVTLEGTVSGSSSPKGSTEHVQGAGRGQFGWNAGCLSREIVEGKGRKAGWPRPQTPVLSWWWRPHGATERRYRRAREEVDRRAMRRLYPSEKPGTGQLQQPGGRQDRDPRTSIPGTGGSLVLYRAWRPTKRFSSTPWRSDNWSPGHKNQVLRVKGLTPGPGCHTGSESYSWPSSLWHRHSFQSDP